jgi:hypothetical protein
MNDRQENKYSAHIAVRSVLEEHAAVWTPHQAFAEGVATFESLIEQLEGHSGGKATKVTVGTTRAKAKFRREFEAEVLRLAASMTTYARRKGDAKLEAAMKTTASALRQRRDTALAEFATTVRDEAKKHLPKLGAYQITDASLTAFSDLLKDYKAMVPAPRQTQVERKASTAALADTFRATDTVLEDLDRLLLAFEKTDPKFVAEYRAARRTLSSGRRRDPDSGEPPPPPPNGGGGGNGNGNGKSS